MLKLSSGFFDRFRLSSNSIDLRQAIVVESFRVGILFVVLLATVLLQTVQAYFINLDTILPIYGVLFVSYIVHGSYLTKFEELTKNETVQWLLFAFDTFAIAGLVLFTNLNHTFFLFLFFIQITLCGLVFRRNGALLLASWVSVLYSAILIFSPDLENQGLVLALVLNNFAFYCTAYLSGTLSEQINFMGAEISRQQEGLRAVKDLNKVVVEQIGTGIVMIDPKRRVEQSNLFFSKMIGTEPSRLLGESVHDILPLSPNLFVEQDWIDNNWPNRRLEIEVKNLEGEVLSLEVILSPIKSAESFIGYVLVVHDVTQIKRLEASIRQSEKLAAVGQLAAGIAHEIRNPLASISGSVQMLESLPESAEDRARLMNIVLREIDRLNGMISEFLEYVRPGEPVRDVIGLSDLLSETLEMVKLNDKLRSDVNQVSEIESDIKIRGDGNKLRQAILNFLINSYQAVEKVESPEVGISLNISAGKAHLAVRDNGYGMDAKTVKKMFEPFHTTKAKGTGLGLAITHKILETHGAELSVRSEPGIGTEVLVEFPMLSALEHSEKSDDNIQSREG